MKRAVCLDRSTRQGNDLSLTGLADFIAFSASLIESSEHYLLCDKGSSFWQSSGTLTQQFLQCHAEKKMMFILLMTASWLSLNSSLQRQDSSALSAHKYQEQCTRTVY